MRVITPSGDLAEFCRAVSKSAFVTVDTEFIRDTTYWPQLCLVQMAGETAVGAIDVMADDIDLAPMFDLMANRRVLKVFHAARQDVEIFFHLTGSVPTPIFDTQVAAMVCGFGDSIGYEPLVAKLVGAAIDKSSRYTDWSRRPLTDRQLRYALDDVTHLRPVYEKLAHRLKRNRRASWLEEEMAVLTSPATYDLSPGDAWRRLKRVRSTKPEFLGTLRAVAAWRESEAQTRDIPRSRVLRDDVLIEIASSRPENTADLGRIRGVGRDFTSGRHGRAVLQAVAEGAANPVHDAAGRRGNSNPRAAGPVVDLLKVLLKMRCEEKGVAQRLVASSADLERIAAEDDADVPALRGWRREIFGDDALALKGGRLGVALDGGKLALFEPRSGDPPD